MIQLPTSLYTDKERRWNIICGGLALCGAALVAIGLITGIIVISTGGGILAALSLVLAK